MTITKAAQNEQATARYRECFYRTARADLQKSNVAHLAVHAYCLMGKVPVVDGSATTLGKPSSSMIRQSACPYSPCMDNPYLQKRTKVDRGPKRWQAATTECRNNQTNRLIHNRPYPWNYRPDGYDAAEGISHLQLHPMLL
jgi:hypothetical protein